MAFLSTPPRIAIVGAGAMGCLFAARLAGQGARITLIDVDPGRLAALQRDGIALTDETGTRTIAVDAARAADVAAPVDLVMLFTKGFHSEAAVASIAHLATTRPVALTLQNGIGNVELLAAAFGEDRTLLGTAHVPADLTGATAVATKGFGHLELGGASPAAQGFAPPLAALFARAGFETRVSADVTATVWEKVAFNAALNAVGMICQVANAGVDNDEGRRIALSVIDETVRVAGAQAIRLDRDRIVATVLAALRDHRHHKASMLQDREHGRQTEIETINGAIAREGMRLGVPTPVCDTLADLVRIIDRSRLGSGRHG